MGGIGCKGANADMCPSCIENPLPLPMVLSLSNVDVVEELVLYSEV